MNAKKCDRCGKLYEYYSGNENKEKANAIRFLEAEYGATVYKCNSYDLCPECMAELIDWLHKGDETDD